MKSSHHSSALFAGILAVMLLFAGTLAAQIKEEITPTKTETKVNNTPKFNSSILIDVDVDCQVFINGELQGSVSEGTPLKIPVNAGDVLVQLKDGSGVQLHKSIETVEKDKLKILSLTLAVKQEKIEVISQPVVGKPTTRVTFIWENADNVKMLLNNQSFFLTGNTPKNIEVQSGEGYLLKIEQPDKKYEYPEFLVFEAKADTLYLQIEGGNIKIENPALRAETKRKNAEAINSITQNMVKIQGGTFTMGCTREQSDCGSDEKPAHQVTISGFYMSKYEVTQAQWRAVMGASASLSNPSSFKDCDDCPVESVNYSDVQAFINQLNLITGKKFRLPTEAEWEYAARGGSASSVSTGSTSATMYSGSNNLDEVAWYNGNSGSRTHPVGQKKPNSLGLYDMSGNVWEWCSDMYDDTYYKTSPANNPKGPTSGSYRVVRGGSWVSDATSCRSANRFNDAPDDRYINFGFRLSQDF